MAVVSFSSDLVNKSIGDRLDRLPWSPFHTRVTLVLGIGWLLDAFEVNVIGNVLGVLKHLWHITDFEASALVTVWVGGIMVGALLFGYLADRFGRRRLFILTLLLYSACTVISAVSPGYYFFLIFRFLTAVGVGAEYSAINAAIGELIPAKFRGRASAVVMNFWPLGAIFAAFLTLFFINLFPPTIGWRIAFGLGAVIALFTVWARRALPESPRWLSRHGRTAQATAVAEQIEAGAHRFSNDGKEERDTTASGFLSQLGQLMRHYTWRLMLGSLLDFTEAAGYYGIFAFLPLIVLPRIHIPEANVPWFFLIGNIGALTGGGLAAVLLDRAGRKITVTSFYVLAALSMLVMGLTTIGGNADAVLASFIVVNFCATGSWVSAYPTFSEIFPTTLRSTGIGFSVAFGRIGAGLAPLALVAVAQHSSIMGSFAVLAGVYAVGALVMVPWILLGPEGRGRSLERLSVEVA
ncbi:MAG: MFS transporter [Alphaproteobacteria bacterium]|nr:MFS transporter [Alphaproteobacteria bacterium]MDE2493566.1 MFS transporter [Alphaproteobacteria bacterium]